MPTNFPKIESIQAAISFGRIKENYLIKRWNNKSSHFDDDVTDTRPNSWSSSQPNQKRIISQRKPSVVSSIIGSEAFIRVESAANWNSENFNGELRSWEFYLLKQSSLSSLTGEQFDHSESSMRVLCSTYPLCQEQLSSFLPHHQQAWFASPDSIENLS